MLEHQATLSQISPAEIFVLSSPPSRPWWQPEASSSQASGKKAASGHAHSNVTAMYTTCTSLSSTFLADDQKIHCWSIKRQAPRRSPWMTSAGSCSGPRSQPPEPPAPSPEHGVCRKLSKASAPHSCRGAFGKAV